MLKRHMLQHHPVPQPIGQSAAAGGAQRSHSEPPTKSPQGNSQHTTSQTSMNQSGASSISARHSQQRAAAPSSALAASDQVHKQTTASLRAPASLNAARKPQTQPVQVASSETPPRPRAPLIEETGVVQLQPRKPLRPNPRLPDDKKQLQRKQLMQAANELQRALILYASVSENAPRFDWKQLETAIDAFTTNIYTALSPKKQPMKTSVHPSEQKQQRGGLTNTEKALLLAKDAEARIREELKRYKAQLPPRQDRTPQQIQHIKRLITQLKRAKRRSTGIAVQREGKSVQEAYRRNRPQCIQDILQPEGCTQPKYCPLSKQEIHEHFEKQQTTPPAIDFDSPLAGKFWKNLTAASSTTEEQTEQLLRPFTEAEVLERLVKSNKRSSPGIDGIPYMIYLQHKEILLTPLTLIYNICRRYRKTPVSWKSSVVSLIPKPGKEDYTTMKSWRPISLQNCIAKIYNALIAKRLQQWAIQHGAISPMQKGFMPAPGCHEHLFAAHSILNSSRRYKRSLHTAWYDLQDAFGSIPQQLIFQVLRQLGLPSAFNKIIKHEYQNAVMYIRTEAGLTPPIAIRKGVKQGCPLSPILFNFALEPLLRTLEKVEDPYILYGPPEQTRNDGRVNRQEPIPIRSLAYADDVKIVSATQKGLTAAHGIVCEYLQLTGLRANPDKCAVLAVKKQDTKLVEVNYDLVIHNSVIPRKTISEAYKYLGVADAISTEPQRMHMKGMLTQALNDTTRILRSALTPQQKIDAYKTFIVPRFNYHLRHSIPLTTEIKAYDATIRRNVGRLFQLGQGTAAHFFHLPPNKGGLGIPSLQQLMEMTGALHTYQMLTSEDPTTRKIAVGQLLEVIACRNSIGAYPQTMDAAAEIVVAFINGDPHPNLQPLGRSMHDLKTTVGTAPHFFKLCQLKLRYDSKEGFLLDPPLGSNSQQHKLKTRLDQDKQQAFKKFQDQGKTAGYATATGGCLLHPLSSLPQRVVQFMVRGRINHLPVRERLRKLGLVKYGTCRLGCSISETLPHVLNHCPQHLNGGIKTRHDNVLNKICHWIKRMHPQCDLLVDAQAPGHAEASRPDIQLIDRINKKVTIIDVAIPFEDAANKAFETTRQTKIEKYKATEHFWRKQGFEVYLDALVYGSLGSVYEHNKSVYINLLSFTSRQVTKIERSIVNDVVRQSHSIWRKHVRR